MKISAKPKILKRAREKTELSSTIEKKSKKSEPKESIQNKSKTKSKKRVSKHLEFEENDQLSPEEKLAMASDFVRQMTICLTGIPQGPCLLKGIRNVTMDAIVEYSSKKIKESDLDDDVKDVKNEKDSFQPLIPPVRKYIQCVKSQPSEWSRFLTKLGCYDYFREMTHSERELWILKYQSDFDFDLNDIAPDRTMKILTLGSGSLVTKVEEETITEWM